tara:strand:- start:1281 stop:5243 length:3963 start_codon:yes stop_codon:yes gene_type:complete
MSQDPYKFRIKILEEINNGKSYNELINCKPEDDTYTGFMYETICDTLMGTKYLINYDKYFSNHIGDSSMMKLTNFNDKNMFDQPIRQHGNPSDRTYELDGYTIPTSIKYRKSYCETDLLKLKSTMEDKGDKYKLSLIVKDKNLYINHKFMHNKDQNKLILDKVIEDNLLLDEKDVMIAYERFQEKLRKLNFKNVNDVIEWMNDEYLNNPRKNLILKLHQYLAFKIIMNNISDGENRHLLSHKPRSGKTITLLFICKALLKFKKKILLMTSVMPEQLLSSFISELKKYNEFKGINYKTQNEFMDIDDNFHGIIFCSVQYLKNDDNDKKMNKLKGLNPDVNVFDECHLHSSNSNTFQKIINITNNESLINIFASGTSNKTLDYYRIPERCNCKWDTIDESKMKLINENIEKDINIDFMNKRHSKCGINKDLFKRIIDKDTLNKDYSKCPKQVLLQPKLSMNIIDKINKYNEKNNYSKKGFSFESPFSLKKTGKGFTGKFQLETTTEGDEFLEDLLKSIISNDPNNDDTIMKIIESTQSNYGMVDEKSSRDNPKLFLVYLPYGPNIGPIDLIEKALYNYIKKKDLWKNYHISYSCSKGNSCDENKDYLELIHYSMEETKKFKKRGCILFLGNQGKVGITYHNCDVTISLDNGTDIDSAKQAYYRSMTEREGKIIGINVDLNLQRSLLYMNRFVREFKETNNQTISNNLRYLYEQNIFLFNPQELNFYDCTEESKIEYFDKLEQEINTTIDEKSIINNFRCEDLLDIKSFKLNYSFKINDNLQGKQQDLEKGDKKKIQLDKDLNVNTDDKKGEDEEEKFTDEEIISAFELFKINKTEEFIKISILPFCAFIMSIDKSVKNIEDYFNKDDYKELNEYFIDILDIKGTKIIIYNIIIKSMLQNNIIVQDLINLYEKCKPCEYRIIIDKYMKLSLLSLEQKEKNAEVPTPPQLSDKMTSLISLEFWKDIRKVGELSCGKGNIVLSLFDRFYNGLEEKYPDPNERCIIIIRDCIYISDLDKINVFVTKLLLCLHAQSYTGNSYNEYMKYVNFNIGDSLEIDIKGKWNLDGFDAFVENPPYNKGKNSNFYVKFMEYAYNNLKENGLILFVIPNRFLIPNHAANKCINKFNVEYIYHTTNDFNVSTDIGYFLGNKKDNINNENVKTIFKNDEIKYINLNIPTPSASNDIIFKNISDKVLYNELKKVEFLKLKKDNLNKNEYLFIPRHWKRYSSIKEKGGTHTFNLIDKYGDDGRYIKVNNEIKCNIIWYLSKSKLIRFITYNYASTVFIPPFIWDCIPEIDFTKKYNDNDLFKMFKLTDEECDVVNNLID